VPFPEPFDDPKAPRQVCEPVHQIFITECPFDLERFCETLPTKVITLRAECDAPVEVSWERAEATLAASVLLFLPYSPEYLEEVEFSEVPDLEPPYISRPGRNMRSGQYAAPPSGR
jgi:hypothetical protein